ncbi:DNA-binding protein [Microbulbifer halophilus]|uniref:DNA-binding protein n=1 Tax=Microbulbifer halophilus TaxID=453963 RepID=A0ABW5EKW5_9GAMM
MDRVRAELGTGSKSTIAPLLKRWRSEAGDRADTGDLPKDLLDALKALHERVREEAGRQVEAARESFEAAEEKHRAEAEEACAKAATLAQDLRGLEHRLRISGEQNRNLKRELQESRAALDKSEFQRQQGAARISELKSEVDGLKQENRDIRDHFEHFQQRTADDRQQEREQFRLTNDQLRGQVESLSEQLSDVGRRLAERENLCEQREAAIAELGAEKQQLLEQVSGYRSEVDSLSRKADAQADQVSEKTVEIATLQDRVSALSNSNASASRDAEWLRQSLARAESGLESTGEKLEALVEENRVLLQEKAVIQGQFNQLQRSLAE